MKWLCVLGIVSLCGGLREEYDELVRHPEKSYVFCDVSLKDCNVFQEMTIDRDVELRWMGNLHLLRGELRKAFVAMGETNEGVIDRGVVTVDQLTRDVLHTSGFSNGFIILRASTPSDNFVVPRWHFDGGYYRPFRKNFPKFVITLRGPATLFQPADCDRTKLFKDGNRFVHEPRREVVASRFSLTDAISPALCQGAFFHVGHDFAAVHSEPHITEKRIFLGIMGVSDENIEEMKTRGWRSHLQVYEKGNEVK